MERLLERCAALDVHQASVSACVRVPGVSGQRREFDQRFGTTTPDLLALCGWLRGHGVSHVAMEGTGVYWKPVYYAPEDEFELLLVNAAHVKQVPGRKTDTKDAAWLCQLLECGLLRASFVPPQPIRELRDLTRYRKTLIGDRAAEANRLHKVLGRWRQALLGRLERARRLRAADAGRALPGQQRSGRVGRAGPRAAAVEAAGAAAGTGEPLP